MAEDRFDERRFEELLREMARDYNAPPATPREEIWARIEAARLARAERRADGLRQRARPWFRVAAALAAALLFGFVLGRWSDRRLADAPVASVETSARVSKTASVSATEDGERAEASGVAPEALVASIGEREMPIARRRPGAGGDGAARMSERDVAPGTPTPATSTRAGPATRRATYEVATVQHLGQAEALLTSFRAVTRRGEADAQVATWARDLLATTRVLLDSHSLTDPTMRALLDDLELVLTQMASLGVERAASEIDLINDAVRQREMLARLRRVVPAGTGPSGI